MIEVPTQECTVAGLVEVEEKAPVVLYEVNGARQPPPGTPVAERGVPLGPRAGMAGQFGRFQPPARRGQHGPAVPHTWKERHRRCGAPVEDGDLRALGAGQFGEEPHQRRGVGAQVQRVHPDGLNAVASLGDGEVHAAAVAPHSQVLRGEDGVLRDAVLLKADHGG